MKYGITKIGTQVRLPDGRVATVVFNGLIGVGCKLGLYDPPLEDFVGTCGDLFPTEVNKDFEWEPDVLLRDPWPGCEHTGWRIDQFVGDDSRCEILRIGLGDGDKET